MLRNGLTKGSTGGLLLAGLAAFAYYKYTKMTPEEKDNITNLVMEKGKSLLGQFFPVASAATTSATEAAPANNSF